MGEAGAVNLQQPAEAATTCLDHCVLL